MTAIAETEQPVRARVTAERTAQGLDPVVTDPAALARVAGLLTSGREVPVLAPQNGERPGAGPSVATEIDHHRSVEVTGDCT